MRRVLLGMFLGAIVCGCLLLQRAKAQTSGEADVHMHHHAHEEHGMTMDASGMVMNENRDRLPAGCTAISQDVKIVVHAGRKYATRYPGAVFAFDQNSWDVPPCSRVTVTLVNEDHVRHQWMIHGLPRYLYPGGMFHIEVSGPGEKSGTFIVPAEKKTYLVHCDVPHHMEKGMKAQLTVLGGDLNLPGIPGLTAPARPDRYALRWDTRSIALGGVGALLGFALAWATLRR